jgi:hypothetical protein
MVIQRISDEEAKKLVEEIRSEMPYGPGNLSEREIPTELLERSENLTLNWDKLEEEEKTLELRQIRESISEGIPEDARKLFNRADHLAYWLDSDRDKTNTIRDVLYRLSNTDIPKDQSVPGYIQNSIYEDAVEIGTYRKNIEPQVIDKWKNLFDIVLFDFVRQKTGGGSCDHYSAGLFLKLSKQYPNAKISIDRYAPKSDIKHKITPPSEEQSFHRVVFLEESGKKHMLDPWWPGGKVVEINENNNDDYLDRATVIERNPNDDTFMNALWIELELRYEKIKNDFLSSETGASVNAVWTVEKNKNL